MAYDQKLAARVRALLSERDDVAERPMFGGLTFMFGGHMCCGVNGDELMARLDPAEEDAAVGDHTPARWTSRAARCAVS